MCKSYQPKKKGLFMSEVFTFTVTNNTELAIAELWGSPDNEEWFIFDLADDGIPAGETVTIQWAEFTNESPCEWWIQAVYEDESETESAQFDFCENPDLEFN